MGPVPEDLVARDEEVEVDARRELYETIKTGKERVERWRMMGLLLINNNCLLYHLILAKVFLPVMMGIFSTLYWGYGLYHYF